jgi:hypothetical protein
MKDRPIKILALILGMLLLAGCHKLEAETIIGRNGSGDLRVGVGFSAEERANMEKQNSNPQDFCNTSQSAPNVTVTEERRGDETWCITTTPFEDLEGLRNLYEQRKGITINRLEIADGTLYYDVDVDTSSEDSNFSTLTEITWTVVLPGTPIAHNADQVDGNTLIWTPTPKTGLVNMRAESEVPSGPNIQICGIAVFGLGGVLILLRRRRMNLFIP